MPRSVPFEVTDRGVVLNVRLTPGSVRDIVEGAEKLADDSIVLKVRVRAIPEDNKANAALIRLLANKLSQRRSDLSLAGGHKSRIKKILIEGDKNEIAAKIRAIL